MHITLLEARTVSATASAAAGSHVLLRGVGKTYGERTVLDAIELDIQPGQFVAVVGRSGCGKSTLLRTIAGLEQADRGSVQAGAHLRLMFQEARLLPWKTVFDNVLLGQPGRIAQARAALDAVGLGARGRDWPSVLSGGQRQRVALARALVSEPSLLLLDEPLGALDALTRMEMQQLIESLWLERGFTAVLVTHDVQEALALADRVLVIDHGRISLDLAIGLPRARRRGTPEFGACEAALLAHLLGEAGTGTAAQRRSTWSK